MRPHLYRYKVDSKLYVLEHIYGHKYLGPICYAKNFETGEYLPARKNNKKNKKNVAGILDDFEVVRELELVNGELR